MIRSGTRGLRLMILACFCLTVACSPRVAEIRIRPPAPDFRMLIAADASKFKNRVRDDIIAAYRDTCAIHVIDIRDLEKIKAEPYDVIVLLDTCLARGGFNLSVNSFLDRPENRAKTVLAMTAGDPDWQYRYQGVDAITAASRPAEEEDFLARIEDGIQAVLQP